MLDTVIELIAHEGIDAVTHRRVAAHAGVPLGSTTYYFASREQMLLEALERFGRQEIAALQQRVDALSTKGASCRRSVQLMLDMFEPELAEDRWRAVAQYTLICEAARRAELSPLVREWTAAWCALLEKLLTALGDSHAPLDAAMLVAMLDGFHIQQLAAPTDDFVSTLEAALKKFLASSRDATRKRNRAARAPAPTESDRTPG